MKHFTYDDYGRMRQFFNGSTLRNQYRYNGRGERIAKINVTSPGSTLYYVYDEAGRLLGEYNSSGVAQKEYLWLDDTLVAILGTYQGHKLQYVLTDHLGTPRAVVLPATNTIIWRWDLTGSAFGDHAVQPNPDGDGANYTLHLRYPGQYFDGESGLHYNYFRDYDPGTGRYVQSDPIGLAGGVGTFSYTRNSPLVSSDPLGLFEVSSDRIVTPLDDFDVYRFQFYEKCAAAFADRGRDQGKKLGASLLRKSKHYIPWLASKVVDNLPEPTRVGSNEVSSSDLCECVELDSALKEALEVSLGRKYNNGQALSVEEATEGLRAMQGRYWEEVRRRNVPRGSEEWNRYRSYYDWTDLIPRARGGQIRPACQIAGTC